MRRPFGGINFVDMITVQVYNTSRGYDTRNFAPQNDYNLGGN